MNLWKRIQLHLCKASLFYLVIRTISTRVFFVEVFSKVGLSYDNFPTYSGIGLFLGDMCFTGFIEFFLIWYGIDIFLGRHDDHDRGGDDDHDGGENDPDINPEPDDNGTTLPKTKPKAQREEIFGPFFYIKYAILSS